MFSQTKIRTDNYFEPKIGIYETKSLEKIFNSPLIPRQTKYNKGENVGLLYVGDKAVALFDRINDKGKNQPVGILTKTSFIDVDTIFYNEIYRDTTKAWHVTYNVWYAIKINGKRYYTDYQIHDFIAFETFLEKFNQTFLLVAKSTGYDYFIDNGYPNEFFALILDKKNELVFETKLFDFNYSDEFWEVNLGSLVTKFENDKFEFTIKGVDTNFTAKWTGKEMIMK